MNAARRQARRLLEGNASQADDRGGGRLVLGRAAAGLVMGLRRGVVGPGPDVGDLPAGFARRRDDDHFASVRPITEGVP
jgi:hypothetical protein